MKYDGTEVIGITMWREMTHQVASILRLFALASILWSLSINVMISEAFVVEHTFTSKTRGRVPVVSSYIQRNVRPNTSRTHGAYSRAFLTGKSTSMQIPIDSASKKRGLSQTSASNAFVVEQSPTFIETPSKLPINLFDRAEQIECALLQSKNLTEDMYVAAIEAWNRAGRPDKAEAIFQHFIENDERSLTRLTYHVLLGTQVRAQNFSRALELLTNMENSPLQSQQPNVRDYNVLLSGYAHGGRKHLLGAQTLIERMEQRNSFNMKPDIQSYSYIMDLCTMADCDDVNVDKRIDEVVDRITSLAFGKRFFTMNFMRPYQVPLNKALKYWKFSHRLDAAERAERIMKRMEDADLADTLSYTQFMTILIGKDKRYSASQIAERVQNIGNNMLQSHIDGKKFVKPSTQTWNTIINAWVQCGKPDSAEEILNRMETEFHDDGGMAPNVISYSTVMDGWVKSDRSDAISHVEKLNERLKQLSTNPTDTQQNVRPNQRTHAALIRAYAKQNNAIALETAEDLLHEMYREYENGNVDMKPNIIVLTTILEAWGVNGTKYGAERAEALLDFALAANKDRNDPTLCPNEVSFSSTYKVLVVVSHFQLSKQTNHVQRYNVYSPTIPFIYSCYFCLESSTMCRKGGERTASVK